MNLLREIPDLVRGLLVHPVIQGGIKVIGTVGVDKLGETTLKAGENVVEG